MHSVLYIIKCLNTISFRHTLLQLEKLARKSRADHRPQISTNHKGRAMSNGESTHTTDRHGRQRETEQLAKDLLHRCRTLFGELEQIHCYVADQKQENTVDLRVFQSHVSAELKTLEKVSSRLSLMLH